jgi:hypothetical protein
VNPYLIALTKDIHDYQLKAQRSYRKAVWSRGYSRAIHKQAVRFCIEQAKIMRIQRERTAAMDISLRLAA